MGGVEIPPLLPGKSFMWTSATHAVTAATSPGYPEVPTCRVCLNCNLQTQSWYMGMQALPMRFKRLWARQLQYPTAAMLVPQPTLWPGQSAKPMYPHLFSPQPLLKPLRRPSAQAKHRPQLLLLLLLWLPTKPVQFLRPLLR